MKRDILTQNRHVSTCCPGHDTFPGDAYKGRLSKRARRRGKQMEHQHARSVFKRDLNNQVNILGDHQ